MRTYKKILFTILATLPQAAYSSECTKEIAFKKGMSIIMEKYPTYINSEPYLIKSNGEYWLIYGTLSGEVLGGTPEAIIAKSNCKLIKLQHNQ